MKNATSIGGRVAKLEWVNPHISLWLYVPKPAQKGQYDLWRFQSDNPGMALTHGWTKDTLKISEPITIYYFPLNNRQHGGYLIRIVRADGKELIGDPDAPGVAHELAKTHSLPKKRT